MDPSNWQTRLSTIRERNEYAFNKSLFCDVEFSVVDSNGVKVTIPANKYILAVSSPVFEAMFYGELAESKRTIDLPDCTKEGLYELLRYVYSDEVNLTESNVIEVLYLAEKYMMPFLVEKCKKYLQDNVGPEHVLGILPHIKKIVDENLQNHLWSVVDRETHRSISSDAFLTISREMLCEILVRDSLNINELDLFRAVDWWVEKRIKEQGLESNGLTKRSILGEEVIRLIRFPLMEQKEFAEVVLPCDILEKNELTELFLTLNKVCQVSPATTMFVEKERLPPLGRLLIPRVRFHKIGFNPLGDGNSKDAICFTVNKTVYLVGVRMFGRQGSEYQVKLKINKNDQTIAQLSSSFLTESEVIDGHYYGFTVDLDKPVKLDPSVVYTVKAFISGPPSCLGKNGQATIAVEDVTIAYKDPPTASRTTMELGQFPTFIFRKIS